MDNYPIILTVLTVIAIFCAIIAAREVYRVRRDLNVLGELFLRYTANPNAVDVIETYPINKNDKHNKSAINFPNTDGF